MNHQRPLLFIFLALLGLPLAVSAQTPPFDVDAYVKDLKAKAAAAQSAGSFDPNAYSKEIETKTFELMLQQEKNTVNPQKIREKAILDYLEVRVTPTSPQPGEQIRMSVESYLSDLDKATITWAVNGKTVDKGIGKRNFSLKNGPSGVTTTVDITILTNKQERIVKHFSFKPVGVTVLWEADTYTPPFYKGKPLLSPQANVRAIVIPDTAKAQGSLNAGNLVYAWKKDGEEDVSSGYGKNSFTFRGPRPYEKVDLRARVTSLDDKINSEIRISIPTTDPFIVFYEKDPLEGVRHNHPLKGSATLAGKEISIHAEPYFFSNQRGNTQITSYKWAVNGSSVENSGPTITLRNNTGARGISEVSLAMRGVTQTFQSAKQALRLQLDEEAVAKPNF